MADNKPDTKARDAVAKEVGAFQEKLAAALATSATWPHTVVCAYTGSREDVVGVTTLPDGWVNIIAGPGRRVTFSDAQYAHRYIMGDKGQNAGEATSNFPYVSKRGGY